MIDFCKKVELFDKKIDYVFKRIFWEKVVKVIDVIDKFYS